MDPPSHGRGPGGEVWKLEEQIDGLIAQCAAPAVGQSIVFRCQFLHRRPVAVGYDLYAKYPPASAFRRGNTGGRDWPAGDVRRLFSPHGCCPAGPRRCGFPPVRRTSRMKEVRGMDMLQAADVYFQYEYPDEPPQKVLGDRSGSRKVLFLPFSGTTPAENRPSPNISMPCCCLQAAPCWSRGSIPRTKRRKYEIRSTVGMVLQNPDNQLVSTIVEEDVAFGPKAATSRRRSAAGGTTPLKAVGMYEYRGARAPTSCRAARNSGLPSRVSSPWSRNASSSTSRRPCCWIPRAAGEVMQTIRALNRNAVSPWCSSPIYGRGRAGRPGGGDGRGTDHMDGMPREVFPPRVDGLRRVELDVPQPTELCARSRRTGCPLPDGVLSVDECVEAPRCRCCSISGRPDGRPAPSL